MLQVLSKSRTIKWRWLSCSSNLSLKLMTSSLIKTSFAWQNIHDKTVYSDVKMLWKYKTAKKFSQKQECWFWTRKCSRKLKKKNYLSTNNWSQQLPMDFACELMPLVKILCPHYLKYDKYWKFSIFNVKVEFDSNNGPSPKKWKKSFLNNEWNSLIKSMLTASNFWCVNGS